MVKDFYKDEYIVVDLETTGLDPLQGHEIIEIGVTEIKKGDITLNYSRLIKPKGIISSFITNLTHMRWLRVKRRLKKSYLNLEST